MLCPSSSWLKLRVLILFVSNSDSSVAPFLVMVLQECLMQAALLFAAVLAFICFDDVLCAREDNSNAVLLRSQLHVLSTSGV